MSKKVVIIDYQLGNLFSVRQACEHLGYDTLITTRAEDLKDADYVILPGVGAFADAMGNLKASGMISAIEDYIKVGKPFMGVCLGLQLLLTQSEEFGNTKGMNIIPGIVKKFKTVVSEESKERYKIPQIQWNQIHKPKNREWSKTPLENCKPGDYMYFVHSLYAEPSEQSHVLSVTSYAGMEYCSSVIKDNVFATQFHPEKSSEYGVNIYKQWFNLYR